MSTLRFSVFSGGWMEIDQEKCRSCPSKPCLASESARRQCRVLELRDGYPALIVDPNDAESGACTECLVCELSCHLEGKGAINVSLPMPELEAFLLELDSNPICGR